MKKKILFAAILILLLGVLLCGCHLTDNNNPSTTDTDNSGSGSGDKVEDEGWTTITPSAGDIYKTFLAGFIDVYSQFSSKNFSSNRANSVSLNGKVRMMANDNELWATLKVNYDHKNEKGSMLAFEFTPKEDDYDDIIIGAYMFDETFYMALGQTKFKSPLKTDIWANYLPLKDVSSDPTKLGFALGGMIVNKTNPVVKERMMGAAKQTDYTLNIDVPTSVQRILSANLAEIDPAVLDSIFKIMKNTFGLSEEDLRSGNIPVEACEFHFMTEGNSIAKFNMDLSVADTNTAGTLFDGEDEIDLKLELKELQTSKSNTPIPFMHDKYEEERGKYQEFVGNAFRVKLESEKQIDENTVNKYRTEITAKFLQEDNSENYLMLEYINEDTQQTERAFYVYKNNVYIFEGNECKLKFEADLSDIALRVLNNDFGKDTEFDWLSAIAVVADSIRFKGSYLSLKYTENLYENFWYNFHDMLDFIDDQYGNLLLTNASFDSFYKFFVSPSNLKISMEDTFVNLVSPSDPSLRRILGLIGSATPDEILSKQPLNDPTESEGTEDSGSTEEGEGSDENPEENEGESQSDE